jgi:ABC-type branched-subunit amino acid transport system substrate-binding protein
MRSSLPAAVIGPLVALVLGASVFGCSLSNVSRTDCSSDTQCAAAFGAASKCSAGFCSDPSGCNTGHDCRKLQGGGACVEGKCVNTIPKLAQCNSMNQPPEPPDLLDRPLVGPDAPIVIGSVYQLDSPREKALTQAIRLAVREINQDGLAGGTKLGVLFCDNGGPGAALSADARVPLDQSAVDYLAGTLGVPYMVGPLTSGDAIAMVNQLKKKSYPTVLISASATSPALTDIDDHLAQSSQYGLFWRTCPNDRLQGKVLSDQVIAPISAIARVTVIYIHDAYGDGLSQAFQDAYGLARVDRVPYDDTVVAADAAGNPTNPAALTQLAMTADGKGNDGVLIVAHAAKARLIIDAMAGLPIINKRFFFTDGTKDADTFLKPPAPAWVQTILQNAVGTAPASPSGSNYSAFDINLQTEFKIAAGSASFLAQAYDATYVGAFGLFAASRKGGYYDGINVSEGMTKLSAGTLVDLNGPVGWTTGKNHIVLESQINVEGTSGHLQFDPATGEAPATIEVWGVKPDLSDFVTQQTVDPM